MTIIFYFRILTPKPDLKNNYKNDQPSFLHTFSSFYPQGAKSSRNQLRQYSFLPIWQMSSLNIRMTFVGGEDENFSVLCIPTFVFISELTGKFPLTSPENKNEPQSQ